MCSSLEFIIFFFFNLFVCIFVLNFSLLVSSHFPSRTLKFKIVSVLDRISGLFSHIRVPSNTQNHNVSLKKPRTLALSLPTHRVLYFTY